MTDPHQRAVRLRGLEKRDPPTRPNHPRDLGEERAQVHDVSQGEPTGGAIDRSIGQWQAKNGMKPTCFPEASMKGKLK